MDCLSLSALFGAMDTLRKSSPLPTCRIRTMSRFKAIGLRHRAANRNPIPSAVSTETHQQLATAILRLHVSFARIERQRP